MAAAAEIRVLLDIRVVAYGKDDPEDADDEHDGDQDDLVTRAEAPVKFIEQIFEEFDHAGERALSGGTRIT